MATGAHASYKAQAEMEQQMIEAGGLTAKIEALQKEREEMARKDAEFSQARKQAIVQLQNEKARYGRYISAVNEEEYLRQTNPAYNAYVAQRAALLTKVQDLERQRDEYRASLAREREKVRAETEAKKAANPNYGLSLEQLYSAQGGGAQDRAYAAEQERKRTAEAAEQVQSERASRAAEALSGGVTVQPRTQAATSYNIAVQEIKATQAKGQDITDAQRMKLMEAAGAFGIDAPEKFVGKESYPEGTKFDYTINLAESLGMSADTGRPAPSVIKSPDMDMVTPQRPPRKKAQTGVQDRLYLAPGFVTEEEQKRRDEEKAKLAALGVTPGTSTILSLTEGFGGDRGERFSLGELEDLTAEEVAEYQKVYALAGKVYELRQKKYFQELYDYSRELKRQGVDTIPIIVNGQTIFVKTERLAGEMKKALQKDPNARVSGFIGLEETLAIKTPQMGATSITQDEQGRVTNIISSLRPPKPPTFDMYPFTPLSIEGEKVTGLGRLGEGSALGTVDYSPAEFTFERTTAARQGLDEFMAGIEESAKRMRERGLVEQAMGEGAKWTVGIGVNALNLIQDYLLTPAEEAIRRQSVPKFAALYTPPTLEGVGIMGTASAAGKVAPITPFGPILKGGPSLKITPENQTKAIEEAGEELQKTGTALDTYVQTYGPGVIPAAVLAAALPGGGKLKALQPVRYVKLPYLTAEGVGYLTRTVKIGYGTKAVPIVGRYGSGKFFFGRAKPELTGIEKIEGPTGKSSFETFELKDYSKQQIKDLTPIVKYAETKGVFTEGEYEAALREGQLARGPQKGITGLKEPIKEEYEEIIPAKELESLSPGIRSKETLLATAEAQQVRLLERREKLTEQFARAKTEKTRFRIFKKIGKLDIRIGRKQLLEEWKGSKIFTSLKDFPFKVKYGDIDVTASSLKKGEEAADKIMAVGAKEGYALEKQGTNIAIGEADSTRAFFDIKLAKGELAHGTDLESALRIKKYGADPEQRPYGMPAFFATEDAALFARFASGVENPRVVVGTIPDESLLLKYRKIPKRERKRIIDESFRMEKKGIMPQWEAYQELLALYAKGRGYKAVTKPYKGLTPDAPKFETIILDKGVFEAKRIEEPTRFGIKKGTGRKFYNIVTEADERTSALGSKIKTDRFYGGKYAKDTFTQKVEGTEKKIMSQGLIQQWQDLAGSQSGIVSMRTLEAAYNLTPEMRAAILGGSKVAVSSLGQRLPKDPVRGYIALWKFAQVAKKSGKTELAREIGQVMGEKIKLKPYIDWGGKLRGMLKGEITETLELGAPKKGSSLSSRTASAAASGTGSTASIGITGSLQAAAEENRGLTRKETLQRDRPTPLDRSPASSPTRSPASIRKSSMSVLSPARSPSTMRSPSPSRSAGSAASPSLRSPASPRLRSPGSAKSPSPKSPLSPKSPSPRSPLSPKSPSPRSPLSPAPSPASPLSPGLSPRSPPSPRSPALRSPLITSPAPPRKPKILPLIRSRRDKERVRAEAERADFLGQAFVSDVVGFAKRKEITYGRKRTAQLVESDIMLTGKRYGSFSRTRNISVLSKSKPGIVKKFKKEKEFKL